MLRSDAVARGPLEHFDILDADPCVCAVCTSWRRARNEYAVVSRKRPDHLPTCGCSVCTPIRRAHFQLQALNVRRDLWIESSYHASIHRYGPTYMAWLAVNTADARRRCNWWAIEVSRLPVSHWFDKFENAVKAGVVSVTGVVNLKAFDFQAYYLEVEIEGGGLASTSSLYTDDFYAPEGSTPYAIAV